MTCIQDQGVNPDYAKLEKIMLFCLLPCRVAGWCRSGCGWWLGDNLLGWWGPVDGLGWPPESFLRWGRTALLDRLPWGRPILDGLPRWLPENQIMVLNFDFHSL